MKTRSLFTAVLLSLSSFAVAQSGATDVEKKSEFQPHWYMQIQAGASHTVGEASFGDLISPAAGIYCGYQFTPLWGLRAGITGWQSKGAWANPLTIYKYNYLQGNIDATLDLGNLFGGYKCSRIVNPYIFAGIGLNGAFNNDEAVALSNQGYKLAYLWDKSKFNVAGRAGLGLNFRLSEKVLFNIEANANVLSDKYNSKKAGNADWQFNLLGGFTFKFGKSCKKAEPVVYEQPAPVQPAPVQPAPVQPAPAPVEEKKEEPAPTPVAVKEEVKPMTQNIFFAISSSDIRESENSKIASLVEYMKENPSSKVTVCGYADKQTGNARFNKSLSKKRAESVADRLKSEGISAERITVDYKGDTEQPFSTMEQNRVSICIAQ